jgi:hypothetical protein
VVFAAAMMSAAVPLFCNVALESELVLASLSSKVHSVLGNILVSGHIGTGVSLGDGWDADALHDGGLLFGDLLAAHLKWGRRKIELNSELSSTPHHRRSLRVITRQRRPRRNIQFHAFLMR